MALGSLGKLFVEVGADTSELEKGLDGAEKRISGLGAKFQKSGKAIGASMAVAGAGMMVLTASSMKTNAALGTAAIQLGVTKEEMRGLALETANVTFPLSEVTASFDLLTRAGMDNTDQIAVTATAFDTLGDAIGLPASEVTGSLIPAFNAFGIPLEDAAKHTDTFTHLMRNTTVELSDFSGMLNYLAADLGTMDISMVQSVAVMEALAASGIQGSAATREFRTAVSGADGDISKFYEALGLTAEEVAVYAGNIADADGMTQEFADAQNAQYTTMDKLKHGLSEATLGYGSMLEPIEALGPVMTTLGPIMILASTVNYAHAASAWAAVAPYLAIAAPIIAVVAVLYILEKKFGLITKVVNIVLDALEPLISWLSDAIPKGIELTVAALEWLWDNLGLLLHPIGLIIFAFENWDKIVPIIRDVFKRVFAFMMNLDREFKKAGINLMVALAKGILSGAGKAIDAVKGAIGKVRDYLPGSDAKVGPLSDLTASGAALMTTFERGIKSSSADPGAAFAARAPQVSSESSTANSYSSSVRMGDVSLSSDYNFEALMKDIDRYQATQRTRRGVR